MNPIEQLPIVLKEIWDAVLNRLKKFFWVIILILISGIALLKFMDTRDFIISCDEYSIESGITCPLK